MTEDILFKNVKPPWVSPLNCVWKCEPLIIPWWRQHCGNIGVLFPDLTALKYPFYDCLDSNRQRQISQSELTIVVKTMRARVCARFTMSACEFNYGYESERTFWSLSQIKTEISPCVVLLLLTKGSRDPLSTPCRSSSTNQQCSQRTRVRWREYLHVGSCQGNILPFSG